MTVGLANSHYELKSGMTTTALAGGITLDSYARSWGSWDFSVNVAFGSNRNSLGLLTSDGNTSVGTAAHSDELNGSTQLHVAV